MMLEYTAARYGADKKKIANARMTVKLNGVIVQNDVEVDGATTAAIVGESPDAGPIHLLKTMATRFITATSDRTSRFGERSTTPYRRRL